MLAAAFPVTAAADTAPLGDLLVVPGSAGLGAMIRSERSPYKGVGTSQDIVPLYLYEGKRFFLHPTRAGLKLTDDGVFQMAQPVLGGVQIALDPGAQGIGLVAPFVGDQFQKLVGFGYDSVEIGEKLVFDCIGT